MTDRVIFSIIIPFQRVNADLEECLLHMGKQTFKSFEVLLLPDEAPEDWNPQYGFPLNILPTGHVNPAVKRNEGADQANGEFLAFIDDDAYPEPDWLSIAHEQFQSHKGWGALGGPAITPKSDPFWARVSGAVFLSRLSGGFPERYVSCPPSKSVEDWPSVNLIVRSEVFKKTGGFDPNYWPGEDTLFCLNLMARTHSKIIYVPDLVVWHHRRSRLQNHLRQVGNYGLHRGFFSKRYPETSRKFKYFIPSFWFCFVCFGWLLTFQHPMARWAYLGGWSLYGLGLAFSWLDIRRYEPVKVALGAIPYIMLTHIWYGFRFMHGLFTKELQSTLGR